MKRSAVCLTLYVEKRGRGKGKYLWKMDKKGKNQYGIVLSDPTTNRANSIFLFRIQLFRLASRIVTTTALLVTFVQWESFARRFARNFSNDFLSLLRVFLPRPIAAKENGGDLDRRRQKIGTTLFLPDFVWKITRRSSVNDENN